MTKEDTAWQEQLFVRELLNFRGGGFERRGRACLCLIGF